MVSTNFAAPSSLNRDVIKMTIPKALVLTAANKDYTISLVCQKVALDTNYLFPSFWAKIKIEMLKQVTIKLSMVCDCLFSFGYCNIMPFVFNY